MAKVFLFIVGVILLYGDFNAAQNVVTRCSSMLRYGGYCTNRRQGCQQGSFEYAAFSNFVGCYSPDLMCCAWMQGQPNPAAPINLAPPQRCGIGTGAMDSRILGGRITGQCDWPFIVSIRGRIRNSSQLSFEGTLPSCAGVLVANNWVLTSPFCILSAGITEEMAPENILVVAGEYNVTGIDIDPLTGRQQDQLMMVEKAFIFPGYRYRSIMEIVPVTDSTGINSHAVALLKLRSSIDGRCSGVACLPTPEDVGNACASYDNCIIAGWGFATENISKDQMVTTLLMGQNQLSSRVACDFLSRRLNLEQGRPAGTTCQGPLKNLTDSCLGDEGGPILCNSNGLNWVVRGILPFNICAADRYNMFVTDVAPYMQWITNTMRQN